MTKQWMWPLITAFMGFVLMAHDMKIAIFYGLGCLVGGFVTYLHGVLK